MSIANGAPTEIILAMIRCVNLALRIDMVGGRQEGMDCFVANATIIEKDLAET